MNMRNRSDRRKADKKAKRKAKEIMTRIWSVPLTDRSIGANASTHCKPCSCYMCRNRRAEEGRTQKEIESIKKLTEE